MARRIIGSSGGGGGGGVAPFTDTLLLDSSSFDASPYGRNMGYTDVNNYARPTRIRGLDTASKAYFGLNCAAFNGGGPGGTMVHSYFLFSANQNTGAITQENLFNTHGTSTSSDYSTFVQASDEWTGRYSYMGHIPYSSGHVYSRYNVLIGSPTTSYSDTSGSISYYPSGNSSSAGYVSPSEHRIGGAVYHATASYGSSVVTPYGWTYAYNTTSANATENVAYTVSGHSTVKPFQYFHQYDATAEPYYMMFMSDPTGVRGRRVNGTWSGVLFTTDSTYVRDASCFFLSNGSVLLCVAGVFRHIAADGTMTVVASTDGPTKALAGIAFGQYQEKKCLTIGVDEFMISLPLGIFAKFKIDPTNGHLAEESDYVEATEILTGSLTATGGTRYSNTEKGFVEPGDNFLNHSHRLYTFGNESPLGPGYGKSKLISIGAHMNGAGPGSNTKKIFIATYDLTDLIAFITYK